MSGSRQRLGRLGEEEAAACLRRRGMRIVERNARCRRGEIDIVAEDGGTVVFVEVKAKSGPRFGAPEEMVTAAKRRRLVSLARWYLQLRRWEGRPARFDVVAVDCRNGAPGRVTHFPDAFVAEEAW